RLLRLADGPSVPRDDGQSPTDFARVTRAKPVELRPFDAPRQGVGGQLCLALEPRRQRLNVESFEGARPVERGDEDDRQHDREDRREELDREPPHGTAMTACRSYAAACRARPA